MRGAWPANSSGPARPLQEPARRTRSRRFRLLSDLIGYAARLEGAVADGLPPVEKWNPGYKGDSGIVIARDGTWRHEGAPITRARLVRLFSTVLKREGDDYFLVTPVEKLGVTVEDAPFLAVLMRAEGQGAAQQLHFTTNVADRVAAGPAHALTFRRYGGTGEAAPYIHVRGGLEARISRALFYDLVALGETQETDGKEMFGVMSGGVFFPFGPAGDVFE